MDHLHETMQSNNSKEAFRRSVFVLLADAHGCPPYGLVGGESAVGVVAGIDTGGLVDVPVLWSDWVA